MRDPGLARIARQISRLRRETRMQARASQAAYRGVEVSDGPVPYYDDDGAVRLQIGEQEDGTFTIVENNPEPPPVPTAPVIEQRPGAVAVTWDGTFEDANTPIDFAYAEIHAGGSPGYFADDSTQIGTFASPQGGTFLYPLEPDTGDLYFSLQAVNRSGVESDKSLEVASAGGDYVGVELSDGVPPTDSLAVSMLPLGYAGVTLMWHKSSNPDPTSYRVFFDSVNPPQQVLSEGSALTATSSSLPDGTLLQAGVTYYARIQAYDTDGDGPLGPVASGKPVPVAEVDIGDFVITTRKFKTTRHLIY